MSQIPSRACSKKTRTAITSFRICIALLSLVSVSAYAQSQELLEQTIADAGRTGLQSFLDKIPTGKEAMYGFHSRTEFARASVGIPYHMYTIADSYLKDGHSSSEEALSPLEEWRLPIIVDGQFRALLTVSKMEGRWRAVDFGAARLAEELGAFEYQSASLAGTHREGIVRVFALHCDFVVLTRQSGMREENTFWPLNSARSVLRRTGNVVSEQYSLPELLPLLQADYSIQHGTSH